MSKVLSVGTSKEAALYFDEVFPDDLIVAGIAKVKDLKDAVGATIPLDGAQMNAVVASLLPRNPNAAEEVTTYNLIACADLLTQFDKLRVAPDERLKPFLRSLDSKLSLGLDVHGEELDHKKIIDRLGDERGKLINRLGFTAAPSWINETVFDHSNSQCDSSRENHFLLSMRELHLVDASKLDWTTVIEFRRDKKARKALRNLRVFLEENFAGKDPAFISDKLSMIEDEYRSATKIWGFETAQKTLSAAFNQQSAMFGSASTLAAALTGGTLGVAAAAGAIVPVGQAMLEFSKVAIDATKAKKCSPIKYLTHLRRLSAGTN